jgi:hypothetical protein
MAEAMKQNAEAVASGAASNSTSTPERTRNRTRTPGTPHHGASVERKLENDGVTDLDVLRTLQLMCPLLSNAEANPQVASKSSEKEAEDEDVSDLDVILLRRLRLICPELRNVELDDWFYEETGISLRPLLAELRKGNTTARSVR